MARTLWERMARVGIGAALTLLVLALGSGCSTPTTSGGSDNSGGTDNTNSANTNSANANDNGGEPAANVAIATADYGCDGNGRAAAYDGRTVAWGDLHAHTMYSSDAIEHNDCAVTPQGACTYALSQSRLDFVAVTDHAEDGAPGEYTQQKWEDTLAQEQTFAEPSATTDGSGIVIFPAFEYTKCGAGFPDGNGHKNIICYNFETVPWRGVGYDILREDIVDAEGNVVLAAGTALREPDMLWDYLDGTPAAGFYLSIPHHPAKSSDKDNDRINVQTDWDAAYVNATVQPLVEIYSRHGSSEMAMAAGTDDASELVNGFDANSSVEAALQRWLTTHDAAYKLGFVGGTDTHDGNPGAVEEIEANTDPRLGTEAGGVWTGGLTGVWVDAIQRHDLWTGLQRKDCYATSGARISLEFTAKLGNDLALMGETLTHTAVLSTNGVGQVNLHVRAVGSDGLPIARVQIFRSGTCIHDASDAAWTDVVHLDYQDALATDYAYYRVKVWQAKPAGATPLPENVAFERAWSSPIWVEPAAVDEGDDTPPADDATAGTTAIILDSVPGAQNTSFDLYRQATHFQVSTYNPADEPVTVKPGTYYLTQYFNGAFVYADHIAVEAGQTVHVPMGAMQLVTVPGARWGNYDIYGAAGFNLFSSANDHDTAVTAPPGTFRLTEYFNSHFVYAENVLVNAGETTVVTMGAIQLVTVAGAVDGSYDIYNAAGAVNYAQANDPNDLITAPPGTFVLKQYFNGDFTYAADVAVTAGATTVVRMGGIRYHGTDSYDIYVGGHLASPANDPNVIVTAPPGTYTLYKYFTTDVLVGDVEVTAGAVTEAGM
jgi:hypothetical protein